MPHKKVMPAEVTPKGVIPEDAKQLSGTSHRCHEVIENKNFEIPAFAGMTINFAEGTA